MVSKNTTTWEYLLKDTVTSGLKNITTSIDKADGKMLGMENTTEDALGNMKESSQGFFKANVTGIDTLNCVQYVKNLC